MNSDIVYEILKFLHICPEENGGAIMAKKVILTNSKRTSRELKIRVKKIEKPIVFDIDYNITELGKIADTNICWNDNCFIVNGCQDYIQRETQKDGRYTIKIFAYDRLQNFVMPSQTNTVHSIGNLTDLSYMFQSLLRPTPYLAKKWDTSKVTNMRCMFCYCNTLNVNLGKNWNTSRVTDMRSMFNQCHRLNKNIGKNWDTSSVLDMSYMFAWCNKLDKNIGKNWNTSKVIYMSLMFWECYNLDKHIGENWNLSQVTRMNLMFGSGNLNHPIVQKWDVSRVKDSR
jgi:hypothetical protein